MKAPRVGAVISLIGVLIALYAPTAAAAATWQITVTRVDTSPQPSGAPMKFRIQAQCAAVDEPECRDSAISWPASAPATFTMPVDHPAVASFGFDSGAGVWRADLQEAIAAGTSIEFDVIASAPNHTTPDGTPVELAATVTATNTPPASASAAGAWSAQANLGIEKYLEFGPDTDALIDLPVRYYLYPCDPSWNPAEPPGHLWVEGVTIVDTLPEDVQFVAASAGGTHDAGANTVTWTPSGILENRNCAFEGPTDYWVEVIFPAAEYGPSSGPPAVIEATNDATVSGYPVGQAGDPSALMSDSDSLLHGFSLPNPLGTHTKRARTPYFGLQNLTFENDRATFEIDIRTAAAGSTPYTFRITDPLPCLTNTPNAATQYESYALGGPACSTPAFRPDVAVELQLDPNYLNMTSGAAFSSANPTLPLRIRTGAGVWQTVDLTYSSVSIFGMLVYRISGADLASSLAGAVVSDVEFDSAAVGLFTKVVPFDGRVAARLTLDGNVAPDTPAFPMLDQYRVRNYGHFHLSAGGTETYIGAIQDSVTIVDRAPALGATKQALSGDYISLNVDSFGGPLRSGEDLIVTDLLPAGVTFRSLSQTFISYGSGQWYWSPGSGLGAGNINSTGYPQLDVDIRNHLTVETVDDYQGTGRQLVRVRFAEPPTPDGWRPWVQGKSMRVSFVVSPSPMRMSYVNTMQAFPSDPVSASNLQCQTGVFGSPTAANSNDPDDLDGDGTTTGDAFCQASATFLAPSNTVDVTAKKWVRGDADPSFRPFPAIGSIGVSGGTADFRIQLTNTGTTGLRNLVIYDVLPHVGDTGTSQSQSSTPRGSQWATTFVGVDPTTVPAGAQIEYSASTTPCRNELAVPAGPFPAGCTNDWSTALPGGGASTVTALRITIPTGALSNLDPGEGLAIDYGVTYPAGLAPGEIAWNNFAFAADRVDTGSPILPSEPPKVGLSVPQVDLQATKSVTPSQLLVGREASYTVTLDHQGAVNAAGDYTMPASTATNVVALDNLAGGTLHVTSGSSTITNTRTGLSDGATFDEATGTIRIPTFGPNDTYVLSYKATRTGPGSATNTVEITSHPGVTDIDSTPGNGVTTEDDQASTTATWSEPRLELHKQVEQTRDSGTYIEADASDSLVGRSERLTPIRYRFIVRNLGDLPIADAQLTDSLIAHSCDRNLGTLAANSEQIIDCEWPFGFSPGTHVNSATVTGSVTVGGASTTVESTDTAGVIVTEPIDLSLTKTVDADGDDTFNTTEVAEFGQSIIYELTVSNAAGAGDASGVTVADALPPGMSAVTGPAEFDISTGIWTVGVLPAGETRTIRIEARIDDVATFDAGGGVNTAAVTAADQPDVDSVPANDVADEDDQDTATVSIDPDDYRPASLGDRVWLDTNRDGRQNDGEVGVADVRVELLNDAGTVVGTTTTDSDGAYLFDGLVPGTYSVRFDQSTFPAGHVLTTRDALTGAADGEQNDSDAEPSTGRTHSVTLRGGDAERDLDAGIYPFTSTVELEKVALATGSRDDVVTWRITVRNTGPDPTDTEVPLTDTLAGGLEFVGVDLDEDVTACEWDDAVRTLGCSVAPGLEKGEATQIDLRTRIVAPAGTAVANQVAVTGQPGSIDGSTITVARDVPNDDTGGGDDGSRIPTGLAFTGTGMLPVGVGVLLLGLGGHLSRRRRPGTIRRRDRR